MALHVMDEAHSLTVKNHEDQCWSYFFVNFSLFILRSVLVCVIIDIICISR
jgi:hypothetical protein